MLGACFSEGAREDHTWVFSAVTEITINLSLIEVEVFNLDSTQALKTETLILICQDHDISGGLIIAERCGEKPYTSLRNYPSGVARFAVGPGVYFLARQAPYSTREVNVSNIILTDIQVGVNEIKRFPINIEPWR